MQKNKKVALIDYGMGNLRSVSKIIKKLNFDCYITNKKETILAADRVILPGVGAYSIAIDNLQKLDLIPVLDEAVKKQGKPFLGICLGMQLLGKSSEEGDCNLGLNWLDAYVEHFEKSNNFACPHMGWNNIKMTQQSPLFTDFSGEPTFYFTHSYIMKNNVQKDVIAYCEYSEPFTAAIQKDNVFGTQFHPEKSQTHGRILIENFLRWKD